MNAPDGGLGRLWRSVPPRTFGCLFASSAAMVVLSFAVPLTVLQAYDRILAYGSRSTLAWLCLGCLSFLVLNALLEYGRGALGAWTAARFVRAGDAALMGRLMAASPETVRREGVERHLERFRSLGGMANAVLARSLPVAAEAPFALGYLLVLVLVGREASLAAVGAAAAELVLAALVRPWSLSTASSERTAERALSAYIVYALERIHFIKAQALEHTALRGFEQAQAEEVRARSRRLSLERGLNEASRCIGAAATFGTILWGGMLVARGELTVGSVSACLFFSSRLVGTARDVRRALFALAEARVDAAELEEGLRIPPRAGAGEPGLPRGLEGRLEFASVSYAPLLQGLSFVLRPGEAGLASCGGREEDAALCRLAAGMVSPTGGQVFLDACPSDRWDFRGPGGVVGYLSLRSGLLPGSILDNVASFDVHRRENALDVAQLIGLDRIVSRLPRGFETTVGPKDGGGLSASAVRLVTIARALALRPRMLVWDEADADLDGESRTQALELLKRLRGGTTLLLRSRDPAFRALASVAIGPEERRRLPA